MQCVWLNDLVCVSELLPQGPGAEYSVHEDKVDV